MKLPDDATLHPNTGAHRGRACTNTRVAPTSTPPCLTGRGNGFSPFGEPQTRGAAGPFQIAAPLKSPSVYEYGDEDLGEREWRTDRGGKNQGKARSESEKEGEILVSLRCFFLPALWPLAGFTHWI